VLESRTHDEADQHDGAGRIGRIGRFQLEAAIQSAHGVRRHTDRADWPAIVALYDALLALTASPVVALNRAVAVAMHVGCEQGIALVDDILKYASMQDYHLAHAARADMCRRLHRWEEARAAYQAALALTQLEPERRFLERRLSEIES
jgi:RNA polymerase sigma-70 factor (ECF subfamily)